MTKEKIAIIGSGISGLSAALFLSNKYEVHIFEKNKILGGHTRTINFKNNRNKSLSIDTGFIVFNERNYPDLTSFFKYLNIKTKKSEMSFSVSSKDPNLEYGGTSLNSLFAQRKNFFSLRFYKLLYEINKVYKLGKKYNLSIYDENFTIEDFLKKYKFSNDLRNFHIYPLISSIWSSNNKDSKNFPLSSFLHFFNNHGLFELTKRPQWKFVKDGSYTYIKSLIKKKLFKTHLNANIKNIDRSNNKIQITENENTYVFDKIVFANHADQALRLLKNPSQKELNILSQFKYSSNKAFLHKDPRCMPVKKIAWSSWNFLQNTKIKDTFNLTYWMNKLQNIDDTENYFVSINPIFRPKNIINETFFEHPLFNLETQKAQKKIGLIQGNNNTFYCGSYCGYGFHEDGIQSAAYISQKLGIELPWQRDHNFKTRLNY